MKDFGQRSVANHLIKFPKLEQAVLTNIEEYFDLVCMDYGLITVEQKRPLLKDIRYVLLDNIAEEVKLEFHDTNNKKLLICVCTADGVIETLNVVDLFSKKNSIEITIDVFFKFTDAFLSIDEETRKLMLYTTEFTWHTDNSA